VNLWASITNGNSEKEIIKFKRENIVLSTALSNVISILTLILILFIYIPNEWFSIANILTLILFKP
jgi:NADH-ubiquinone oxidoreductase chain 2